MVVQFDDNSSFFKKSVLQIIQINRQIRSLKAQDLSPTNTVSLCLRKSILCGQCGTKIILFGSHGETHLHLLLDTSHISSDNKIEIRSTRHPME